MADREAETVCADRAVSERDCAEQATPKNEANAEMTCTPRHGHSNSPITPQQIRRVHTIRESRRTRNGMWRWEFVKRNL